MEKIQSLEEKQKIYFNIAVCVDKFCRSNGINYFLSYGTLLGAIRHKGPIPWDDDFDIMMLREDYEKFARVFHDDRYKLVNCYNDKSHYLSFPRIYDSLTVNLINGKYLSYGLGIDVYLIDKVPQDGDKFDKYNKELHRLVRNRDRWLQLRSFLIGHNLWPAKTLNFSPISHYCRILDKHCKSYQDLEQFNYVVISGPPAWDYPYEASMFSKTINVDFDGYTFMAPEEYDKFLTQEYGDYMQLPPEDKRHPYHGGLFFWK